MTFKHEPSAPAIFAATVLMENFRFTPKPTSRFPATNPIANSLAVTIDVCTDIFRCEKPMDRLLTFFGKSNRELLDSMEQIKAALQAVDVASNHLPRYDVNNADPASVPQEAAEKGAREEAEALRESQELSPISRALQNARSPEQEQEIVRQTTSR